jgi:hypothetical protein
MRNYYDSMLPCSEDALLSVFKGKIEAYARWLTRCSAAFVQPRANGWFRTDHSLG